MFDRIDFLCSEALMALRRNPLLTLAAVTTVAVALFLLGSFGAIYYRAVQYGKTLPSQFEMRVYVKDGVEGKDLSDFQARLEALAGVSQVTFIGKEEAWAKMRRETSVDLSDLVNPLPDGFSVTFKDLKAAEGAADSVAGDPVVEKVIYQKDLLRLFKQGLALLRYVGYFGVLLFLIGGIIIYNAIRLTVVARRVEIRIMQLVGASGSTIRIPFMIEGIVHGVAGGLLATLMLYGVSQAISRQVATFGWHLPRLEVLPAGGILVAIGALLGFFCSTVAVGATAKYR